MFREVIQARPNWQTAVEEVGFTYHTPGEAPADVEGVYWDETVCYRFNLAEVEAIEAASEVLHDLCLKAVDHIVANPELMDRFQIPAAYRPYIAASWNRRDPYVMGRFDLAFDPATLGVKMLEYNADTPTLVIETAVVQWFWLQDQFPNADQFNSLHERLIEQYASIGKLIPKGEVLHFSSLPATGDHGSTSWSAEEFQHSVYFQDLAQQAGIATKFCAIEDVGYNACAGFVDLDERPISFWSKLYPWEWLAAEPFGHHLPDDRMGCLEPVWKMLISNKAILPILWQLFPDCPYLLPAFFEEDKAALVATGNYVAKPILAREGANIRLAAPGQSDIVTEGSYGASPLIYQQRASLPVLDGNHVVIGSWMVGENAAGMIIREAENAIVVNTSKVVPHYFKD